MAPNRIWPFDPALFFADTKGLSDKQAWGYFRLLCHYWINRGLPDADHELAHIAGMDLRTWKRWHRKRLQKFFYDGWRHRRMERDLEYAAAYRQRQRTAANRRWHPVDNGEHDCRALLAPLPGGQPLKRNSNSDAAAYAAAMPLNKITNNPFGTRRLTDVDNLMQTAPVVDTGNTLNQRNSPPPAYRRAQQRLLRTLLADLGERAFAELIETFAADADFLHRATITEQRKPNSGAAFVVTELQRVR